MPFARLLVVIIVVAVAAAAVGLTACGSDSCPLDLPAACPTPAPSWASDVQPLMTTKCAPCHYPGGTADDHDLSTYDAVFRLRSSVLDQTYACQMPPSGAPGLSSENRATLLGWLVCHAPNN